MLKDQYIVGIAGKAGHGKSEVSRVLRRLWVAEEDRDQGYTHVAEEVAFAAPIKNAIEAMLGIDDKTLEYWKRVPDPVPPLRRNMRYLLQTLGTDWGRNMIQPDIWVELWVHLVKNAGFKPHLGDCRTFIVAPDVRFQNEVDAIKALGGMVVSVERPGFEDAKAASHASEAQELAGIDYTIANDGTLVDLRSKAIKLFYDIIGE